MAIILVIGGYTALAQPVTPSLTNTIKFVNPRIIDTNGTVLSIVKVKQQVRIEFDLMNQTKDLAAFVFVKVNDTHGNVADSVKRIPISFDQTTLISPPFVLTSPGNYTAQISFYQARLENTGPHILNNEPITQISIKIMVDSAGYVAPNPSQPVCAYDLIGYIWVNSGSCPYSGTPTILSQSMGLSPTQFQGLIDDDKKFYMLDLIHAQCQGCSDSFISQFCSYDSNGELIKHYSDFQKQVLEDLNRNYSVFICPFKGTPTPSSPTPPSPNVVTAYPVANPISPTCRTGQILVDNLCLAELATCPQGFDLQNGICVSSTNSCPSGSSMENGQCYSILQECDLEHCHTPILPLSCPQGSVTLTNQCVLASEVQPTPPMTCPEGFGFQDHTCIGLSTLPKMECSSGTILQNGMCITSNSQFVENTHNDSNNASAINSTNNITANSIINKNTNVTTPSHEGSLFRSQTVSPLKQLKSGIMAKNIQCRQDFTLILKLPNDFPMCIKPQTAQKLVERGWQLSINPIGAISDQNNKNTTTLDVSYVIQHLDSLDGKEITVNGSYAYRMPNPPPLNCGWIPTMNPPKSKDINSEYIASPWGSNYLVQRTSLFNFPILELRSANESSQYLPVSVPSYGESFTVTGKLVKQYLQDNCGSGSPIYLQSAYLLVNPDQNSTNQSSINYTNITPALNNTELSNTINLVTQNGMISIPATITPDQTNSIKLISVGLSPYPLKVGDIPMLNATFQNISDSTFYVSGGCRATSLFFTIDPSSSAQEHERPKLMCADWAKEIKPNENFGWVAHSKLLNGYYKIVDSGLLTITMYQYVSDEKTGERLAETIQFNVNVNQ